MTTPRLVRLLAPGLVALLAALPATAADQTITTGVLAFNSPNRTIQTGDRVTWQNTSLGFHNVRSDDAGFRCSNGCDGEGGNGDSAPNNWSFTRTFNTAGTFVYWCEVHGNAGGGMRGVITVQGGGGPGSVRFSASNYNVNEGGSNVILTLQRVGGDDGAVSVHYATSNGTANSGSDYTAKSGTVNWADNDDNNKTVTIAILNDPAQESSEKFNVALSNPGAGATLGNPSTATVTIADNDGGGGGAPTAPPVVTAGAISQTQIQLNWTDPTSNETGFVIEARSGTGSGAFAQVGTASANATGAVISQLDAGHLLQLPRAGDQRFGQLGELERCRGDHRRNRFGVHR